MSLLNSGSHEILIFFYVHDICLSKTDLQNVDLNLKPDITAEDNYFCYFIGKFSCYFFYYFPIIKAFIKVAFIFSKKNRKHCVKKENDCFKIVMLTQLYQYVRNSHATNVWNKSRVEEIVNKMQLSTDTVACINKSTS